MVRQDKKMTIFLDEPEIMVSDKAAVHMELQYYPFSSASPTVRLFEEAMAQYLNVPETVAVNSGTAALHLALLASGVKPGDEVIMPALTFVGTANAVSACGAKPVFVDVDLDTWCIKEIEWEQSTLHHQIVPKLKSRFILPVDLYGNLAYLGGWPLTNYYKIIADSAESLGSLGKGNADFVCFSFNGNKILTTGAGGLIVGNGLSRIRRLANQGRGESGECIEPGFNYRMTGMQAALGLSQFSRLSKYIERKRKFNEIYRNELPMLKFQEPTPRSKPNWWFTAALFPEYAYANIWQGMLKEKGIPTRRIFKPLYQQEAYIDYKLYSNSDDIYQCGLCLPSSVKNHERDIMYVCEKIKEILK